MASEKNERLFHQSGVNPKGEPFVQLLLDGKIIGQLTPEDARDHARAITEAAEAAEQDAFLMDFLQNKMELPFESAGHVLMEFREFRKARTGKSQGPTKASDWVMPPPPKG
jgi:hypothetical protein